MVERARARTRGASERASWKRGPPKSTVGFAKETKANAKSVTPERVSGRELGLETITVAESEFVAVVLDCTGQNGVRIGEVREKARDRLRREGLIGRGPEGRGGRPAPRETRPVWQKAGSSAHLLRPWTPALCDEDQILQDIDSCNRSAVTFIARPHL